MQTECRVVNTLSIHNKDSAWASNITSYRYAKIVITEIDYSDKECLQYFVTMIHVYADYI